MSTRLVALGLVALSFTLVGQPAHAFTPVSELKDVTPDHWAYNAIKALVEKYQVMDGFPDNTFKGTRTVSRFELASILARVMSRVEEMIQAGGVSHEPTRMEPSVSPDDLRTIARLQQEFKDELTALKQRVDTQDARLGALEKRMRLSGSLEGFYRTFPTQPQRVAGTPDDVTVRTTLHLDTNLSPELSYRGSLVLLNLGLGSLANGHQLTEVPSAVADQATPLYVRRSLFSWTPAGLAIHVGVMTLSDTLRVGSSLRNEFRSGALWPDGLGGYGFIGTPPLAPHGGLVLVPSDNTTAAPIPSGRVRWNAGVNVVEDLLDPNSVYVVNSGAAPCAVITGNYGPVEAGVGFNYGTPGADPARALTEQPANYPLIAPYGDGYTLAKLGVDLGWARWGLYGRSDNAVLNQVSIAPRGRGWGTTLDLGSDLIGLCLGHAETSRRAYDLTDYGESSVYVTSSNLIGAGWQFGVGAKFGNMPLAMGAVSPYYDWASTGMYMRVPGISVVPSVLFAFQTSGQGLLTSDYGSGFTTIAEIQITPALPSLMLEYSQGHFYGSAATPTPATFGSAALANQLVGGALQTHELLTLGTSVKF